MNATLRIIDDTAHNAAFNMAADLWLMEQCKERPETIFLRLYEWEPFAVSIGYMQDVNATLDLQELYRRRIDWVRRSTGGRAVLHAEDLTYSVVFSTRAIAMGSSVSESYALIAQCLREGLANAGLACSMSDSTLGAAEQRAEIKLPCFLSPNRNEIVIEGRKLIGSAQRRTSTAVLQHGSLPITPAYRDMSSLQPIAPAQQQQQTSQLREKSTCLREVAPLLSVSQIRNGLYSGFARVLGLTVKKEGWHAQEQDSIDAVARSEIFGQKWLH